MALSFEPDEINLEPLERLTKAVRSKNQPFLQVGVIGQGGNRRPGEKKGKSPLTNADIGAVHEYGSPVKGIPARSWLRFPLKAHLQEFLEKWDLLTEKELAEVGRTGSLLPWLKKVEVAALACIDTAFQTGGWGTWRKWKRGYKSKTGLKLVDTEQLRRSVASRTVEK